MDTAAVDNMASSTNIELIPARNKGGPYFIITPSSARGEVREVSACDIPTFTNSFNPELYFPCHENCVKIVEWIVEARGLQREDGLRRVHDELKKQLDENIKVNITIDPVTNLGNAGKYGTLGYIQELVWRSYLEGTEVSDVCSTYFHFLGCNTPSYHHKDGSSFFFQRKQSLIHG